ncbi:DNA-directed RNA polymerase subunit omega [Candidatus Termititenax persephonae]|uniref:DNA-directed RNA polymerase subunit omega n=1 Tax=Candidatus Termititenax persephonae TaxID=2218525 RepID=A0A388TEG5_9BACT|nr:DNA-directed RNA polymerase subunit omega [Candidatus Termititenax persephonae]
MKEIVLEEVLKKLDNNFMLSVVAAKRARQLKDGAIPQVEHAEDDNDLLVALGEINEDKIKAEIVLDEPQDAIESTGARIIENIKKTKKKSEK